MQVDTLRKAVVEAHRFLDVTKQVKIKTVHGTGPSKGKTWQSVCDYTKESAACRRASLDLTRALSELRK